MDSLLDAVRRIEPILRENAAAAERDRRLSPQAAAAMREQGLYRLWRPKALGGLEADPMTGFRVIEELGRIDSAASWNLQVSIAHDLFGPWFPDAAAREIFGGDAIVVGGQQPARRAVPVTGGYLLSGSTPFVSGAHQATAFLGYANTIEIGDMRRNADDAPETLLVAFSARDAKIVENWNVFGMRGTGSHDVDVVDAFIPAHWAVPWEPLRKPGSAYEGPLYRLTVWPAIAALTPPALGIARAAIDEAIALITKKTPAFGAKKLEDNGVVQSQLARAEARLSAGRAFFYEAFEEAYGEAVAARPIDTKLKGKLQLATTHAMLEAAAAVDIVHEIIGASGVREEFGFARHFRDIHVITQHGFINAAKLQPVGQIMLGLAPDWPFFAF
ncbi:acyl-CoA dehydrogenase family protein [Methylocystis sp. MJC1]|uniref:acyl-CoA dehydrogenase family protein n=1 Tax=Methylocystis sp. MJC1 TaxID=2654282 RepID=UPI0013EA32F0|nr:acyl-CoA dehydrogenase family protein [Methylocystis sp. MJC1]MBU6526993.1 acyl-CoA dehydrogenase family protein [Methylocystis sp. MJC1]UZX13431.1 acyl-CoA dehydrogenase family protein [Methylocystis sp. MJC1]